MFVKKSTHAVVMAEREKLRSDLTHAKTELDRTTSRLAEARTETRHVGAALKEALAERDAARTALRMIIELETPGCAHVGRKMANTARAGLPEYRVANAA